VATEQRSKATAKPTAGRATSKSKSKPAPKRHGLLRRRGTAPKSKAATKPHGPKAASKQVPRARPQSRAERRHAAKARRSRFLLVCSVAFAVIVLAAWFPASSLFHQRQAEAAAASQLTQLRQQDQALRQEQTNLNSPAEIQRIAREQYQLVLPGQQAYQVLPPNGTGTGAANEPYAGDPGLQPPVSPSAAVELPPGSVSSTTIAPPVTGTALPASNASSTASHATTSSASGGFLQRVLQTFEFWK